MLNLLGIPHKDRRYLRRCQPLLVQIEAQTALKSRVGNIQSATPTTPRCTSWKRNRAPNRLSQVWACKNRTTTCSISLMTKTKSRRTKG
jgi:hypothetical protein